jgi:hypothetical protein
LGYFFSRRNSQMLRGVSVIRRCRVPQKLAESETSSSVKASRDGSSPAIHRVDQLAVPKLDMERLARYIPTDPKSFLVEEHRLSSSENVTQKVSSILPWVMFGVFAVTPFLVMKYNLTKLSAAKDSAPSAPTEFVPREKFRHISFRDMPEVIDRRKPTLVGMFSDTYHSSVVMVIFREIDRLLDEFKIDTSVAVFDLATVDSHVFTEQYLPSLGPYCQLVTPGNKLFAYSGPFTVEGILGFILGDAKVSPALRVAARESDVRMRNFQKCVFAHRFVHGNTWSVHDTLLVNSLEEAIARCENSN